jgi:hypothetical protein
MSPLGFVRQVRYAGVKDVALVQTGAADLVAPIAERLRGVFPGCSVHVVLRADAAVDRGALGAAFVEVAPRVGRRDLVRRLRQKRFDVVAIQLTGEPLGELAAVALALRTRSLVAFNQNLDHFPINVHRLSTIARHFGASASGGVSSLVSFAIGSVARAGVGLLACAYVVLAAGWLHLRGFARRRARAA